MTITPQTQNAPTVTSLQIPTNSVETGESIALDRNRSKLQQQPRRRDHGVCHGVPATPSSWAKSQLPRSASRSSIATDQLQNVGTYEIEAVYLPNTNRFAESTSAPVTVTVTPLTAASFRVTPVVRHGHLNKPMSFMVTALDAQGSP